jgi:hypothetical protein
MAAVWWGGCIGRSTFHDDIQGAPTQKSKKKKILVLGFSIFFSLVFLAIHQHKTKFFSLYQGVVVKPRNIMNVKYLKRDEKFAK